MRITWFSNSPLASTGYGNQTRLFTPLIKELGHEINIQAFFGHEPYNAPFNWNGMTVTGRGFHPYGQDVIAAHALNMKSDILITLLDAWVFDLRQVNQLRWCPWFPVDHDPIPPKVLENVRYAFARLVYSKFAAGQMEKNDLDYHYIPHGVDTKIFESFSDDLRVKSRQAITKLPVDAFVVGMVAANKGYPSRKAFEQNIAAFKMLADKHPDAVLYLHTWSGEGGGNQCVDLPEYCRRIGLQLGKNVFFCDQMANVVTGFPDVYMVGMYNSLDVLLSVSRGEGFGLPILEAQACGVPVITGDWTSMTEITFSGWKVDKKETVPDFTQQYSYQFLPRTEAIYEKLEAAYTLRGNTDYRRRAREGAEQYDVRKVTEKYWKPVLEQIAGRIEKINALKKTIVNPMPPMERKPVEIKEVEG